MRKILENEATDAIGVTGLRTLFIGIFAFMVILSDKERKQKILGIDPSSIKRTFLLMGFSGVVGWVIGATAFFYAVQLVGASIPTPISSTNPIFATLFGVALGIEDLTKVQFTGVILSVVGTIVILM